MITDTQIDHVADCIISEVVCGDNFVLDTECASWMFEAVKHFDHLKPWTEESFVIGDRLRKSVSLQKDQLFEICNTTNKRNFIAIFEGTI